MAYELTDAEEQLLKEVNEKFETSEKYLKPFRERADYLYSLYTTHRRTMRAARVSPPDRDTIIRDYKRDWGAELHIPIAFHSVETILPRAVSNRPRMLVLPKDEASEQNVKNMRALLDEQ